MNNAAELLENIHTTREALLAMFCIDDLQSVPTEINNACDYYWVYKDREIFMAKDTAAIFDVIRFRTGGKAGYYLSAVDLHKDGEYTLALSKSSNPTLVLLDDSKQRWLRFSTDDGGRDNET